MLTFDTLTTSTIKPSTKDRASHKQAFKFQKSRENEIEL